MSMNNSIMAGVGRPLSQATAVRVPIQGPYNTLVIVHLRNASVIPGIEWNLCNLTRNYLSYPSNFILQGFDQRVPPDFQHSTTGFLSYLGTGNDATFTYAIDDVSARFDETGRYWVNYHAAMHNDCEISAASCSLSSWLLVNEPRIRTHSADATWFMLREALSIGNLPGFAVGAAGMKKMLKDHDCKCDE